MAEHERELLQLIEGTPNPPVTLAGIAEQIGIGYDEAERLAARLEREGRLLRDGDRLIALEPSAGD